MRSGIYRIKCLANDTVYVGQASNLSNRTAHHRQRLRKNKHSNRHLQNAFNKYGESEFDVAYLMHCEPGELTWYEQRVLDIYRRNFKVFNTLAPVDTPMLGQKRIDGAKGAATLDKYRWKAHLALAEKRATDPDYMEFTREIGRTAMKRLRANPEIEAKRKKLAAEAQRKPELVALRRAQINARYAEGWTPKSNPNKTAIIDTSTGVVYPSYTEAAEAHGVGVPTIHRWVNGRRDGRSKQNKGKPHWRIYEENI